MKGNCNVQGKVSCLFKIVVKDEPTRKRAGQLYRVVASESIVEEADLTGATATEKIDGTCCYVRDYNGKPWVWARLDKKLTKAAERKFREFQKTQTEQSRIEWDVERDFKKTPAEWIPAKGVTVKNGNPLPDENGHIPGWIPLSTSNNSQCWHNSAAILSAGVAIVLSQPKEDGSCLCVSLMPLGELCGRTLELIGTNVNGNPYRIGNKRHPVHFYVVHGDITFCNPPLATYHELKDWFSNNPEGAVEGVVWHCQDRNLFKVSQYQLDLKWPIAEPRLTKLSVNFELDHVNYGLDASDSVTLCNVLPLNCRRFDQLSDLPWITDST